MFDGAQSFNQDISGWDVSNVASYNNFSNNSGLEDKHKPHFKN